MLERPRIVAPVCKRVPARMPQHVRVGLECQLGPFPARSIIRAKPAVVNGAPRSDVNTKGDLAPVPLKPPERPHLAEDRMRAGSARLDPTDVQVGRSEVHLLPPQVHQFGSP